MNISPVDLAPLRAAKATRDGLYFAAVGCDEVRPADRVDYLRDYRAAKAAYTAAFDDLLARGHSGSRIRRALRNS